MSIEAPVYDPKGKETINQYIRRVEKYQTIILKEKYDKVLLFVNEWLTTDYNSLSEFKNLEESFLLKKEKKSIVDKYYKIFSQEFGLNPDPNNEDEEKERNIINFLIKLLDYINYKLIKRTYNDKFFYSIRKA